MHVETIGDTGRSAAVADFTGGKRERDYPHTELRANRPPCGFAGQRSI
jgi:hypothetical protein